MADLRWMVDHLKTDLALQWYAYSEKFIRDLDRKKVTRLAELLKYPFDWNVFGTGESSSVEPGRAVTPMQVQVAALLNHYGQRATIFILQEARLFAAQHGKAPLVLLTMTTGLEDKRVRDDQEVVDYLANDKFDYVDLNHLFRDEIKSTRATVRFSEYMKQYMVNGDGHFNPRGNHFVAYALKEKVISMLDPKPVPYQPVDARSVNFEGYLHGGGYK